MAFLNPTIARLTFVLVVLSAKASGEPQASAKPFRYYKNPHTLSGVAQRFKLTVGEIAKLNGIENVDHFNAYGILLPDTPYTKVLPRYVPWVEASSRSQCSVTPWVFAKADQTGCEEAYCSSSSAKRRGCICLHDGIVHVTLEWPKGPPTKFEANPSVFNPFGSSMFEVADIDLDDDGNPETLVSQLEAVSNGIGQEFRTLVVYRDGNESVRYDSGEATASTAAMRIGTKCHLISRHYEEATEPLRGTALYLVERTFDPVSMRMDSELVGRRISDKRRYILPREPSDPTVMAKRVTRPERGIIVASRRDTETGITHLVYRVSNATLNLKIEPFTYTNNLRLGDAHSKRLFPEGTYWRGLRGQSATLEQRSADEASVLWLGK